MIYIQKRININKFLFFKILTYNYRILEIPSNYLQSPNDTDCVITINFKERVKIYFSIFLKKITLRLKQLMEKLRTSIFVKPQDIKKPLNEASKTVYYKKKEISFKNH
jgi:hypothetical protein